MGLVFVLLLGEIDLSAGFAAGIGGAILATTLTEYGWAVVVALARGARDRRGRSACSIGSARRAARHPVASS